MSSISRSSAFISSGLRQAAGADRAVAGHGGGDVHQAPLQRQRLVPFGHVLGEIAQRAALALPSSDGVSRTATAPGPKNHREPEGAEFLGAVQQLLDRRSSSSTISGISRICRCAVLRQRPLQLFIDDTLMGGVLVYHDQAVAGLRHDVGLVDLRARRAGGRSSRSAEGCASKRTSAVGVPTSKAAWPASASADAAALQTKVRC